MCRVTVTHPASQLNWKYCRLVNKSGLRLSYWVDGPDGRSEAFSVNSWEEGPLHVEPVEKHVVLSDTQLQVLPPSKHAS